jgi:hypothetical protein
MVRHSLCIGCARVTRTIRRAALLLIDVIDGIDFEGSARLAQQAIAMTRRLRVLKQRTRRAGIPTI